MTFTFAHWGDHWSSLREFSVRDGKDASKSTME